MRPSTRKRMDDLAAKVLFAVGGYENPAGFMHFLDQLPRGQTCRGRGRYAGEEEDDCVGDTERMVAALRSRAYPSLEIDLEDLARRVPRNRTPAEPVAVDPIPVRRAPVTIGARGRRGGTAALSGVNKWCLAPFIHELNRPTARCTLARTANSGKRCRRRASITSILQSATSSGRSRSTSTCSARLAGT